MTERGACEPDEALARARGGDGTAFAALVRQHQRAVYSLALRMLADRAAAEDLAQEVFLQLYRNLGTIQSGAHLVFWLRRVTAHRAIDQLRREPRHAPLPGDGADEPRVAASETDPRLSRTLRTLVAQLRPDARAVIVLRYQEDLDPSEIAALLEMPVNSVKSHLRRSLEALRTAFAVADPARPAAAGGRDALLPTRGSDHD